MSENSITLKVPAGLLMDPVDDDEVKGYLVRRMNRTATKLGAPFGFKRSEVNISISASKAIEVYAVVKTISNPEWLGVLRNTIHSALERFGYMIEPEAIIMVQADPPSPGPQGYRKYE